MRSGVGLPIDEPDEQQAEKGKPDLTIPNLITILRFLLVPVVVLALLQSRMDWALAGFLIAGISDGVDGFIARQFNQRSELGAYLDPMADKLLLVSVFVVLGYHGRIAAVAGASRRCRAMR